MFCCFQVGFFFFFFLGGGHIVVFVPLGVIVFWMRALLVLSTGPCQAQPSLTESHISKGSRSQSQDVLNIVLS